MKFRLLRRRLTISAPRMAVRSAVPWPLRWVIIAIVFGFCAAISLWAFEFGRSIAGLDRDAKQELAQLRTDVARLRTERDQAQSIANTSGSLMTAEKAAQEKLAARVQQLEADNQSLRDDLGFFEKLLPTDGSESIAIRGLKAEVLPGNQVRWQILLMQPGKASADFNGKLEISLTGSLNGKPWTGNLPAGAQVLQFRQYRRIEGVLDIPPQAMVKTVSAKVMEGSAVRAVQTAAL